MALQPFLNHIQTGPGYEQSIAVLCKIPVADHLADEGTNDRSFVYVESLDFPDGRRESPPAWSFSGWDQEYLFFIVADSSFRAEITLQQEGPSGIEPISRIEVLYKATQGSKETMCTDFRELYTYHAVETLVVGLPEDGMQSVKLEGCYGDREPDWQGRTLIWVPDQPCTVRVVLREQGLRAATPGVEVDQGIDNLTIRAPDVSALSTYEPSQLEELQGRIDRRSEACLRLSRGKEVDNKECLGRRVAPVQAELDAALEALDDLKEE